MQDISWAPMVLFVAAIFGCALVEHLRTRDRKRASRGGFRRMQSPYARPRHRTEGSTARAAFARPYHADVRRGFAR
jgi:hypothetical protein